jgi:hypothetical protein
MLETLGIMKFLAWAMRSLDVNMDGMPDSVGLTIGHVLVEDIQFPLTPTETIDPTISMIIETELHYRFTSKKCCAIFGFVFHNILEVLSFTNLSKNILTK